MAKLIKLEGDIPEGNHTHLFFCPGCKNGHGVDERRWTVTGTPDAPTVRASLLIPGYPAGVDEHGNEFRARPTCHSFITDGRIEFLSDSTHELAGQTVDLPNVGV